MSTAGRTPRHVGAAVTLLAAAALAVWLGRLTSLISPLLWAMVVGIVVANVPRWRRVAVAWGTADLAKLALRLGVGLLGLKLTLDDVVRIGPAGAVVIVVTVLVTHTVTRWYGKRLGLDHGLVFLVAAGFSICGAAAIAAVQDAVKARQQDVAAALALVTVFGSLMIVAVPWSADALGLDDVRAGIWAGASIHEVAQVIAAASITGAAAVPIASAIKLGRIMLLAPVYAHAARASRSSAPDPAPVVPWFLVLFVALFAIALTGIVPSAVVEASSHVTTWLLAMGMVGLGLGVAVSDLVHMPRRAVLLALVATAVAWVVSGVLVVTLV